MTTWTAKAPFPPSLGTSGAMFGVVGGKLYVALGRDGGGTLINRVLSYDPTTDAWTEGAILSFAGLRFLSASAVVGTKLYGIGGSTDGITPLSDALVYDTVANSWVNIASPPQAINGACAAAIGTKIYVAGGTTGDSHVTNLLQVYDTVANTWTTKAVLPTARMQATAFVMGGKLYVTGGWSEGFGAELAVTECYDPATDAWTTKAPQPFGNSGCAGAVVGGRFFLVGGNHTLSATSYGPNSDRWARDLAGVDPAGPPRNWPAVGAIAGKLYVVAGDGPSGVWNSVEELSALNTPPNAPAITSPASGTPIDRTLPLTILFPFSDHDPDDTMSAYDLQYRLAGAASFTADSGHTSGTGAHTFPANTFAIGSWELQVRTYDQSAAVSPWSSSLFFTAANPSPAPVIVHPVSGGVVGAGTDTVTWTSTDQVAWEIQRIGDVAGAPDPATVYADLLSAGGAGTTKTVTVAYPINNHYEHVRVRVKGASGLWSGWADRRVLVFYTPPGVPTVAATPDVSTASITVAITNPTPIGGQPSVVGVDLYRRRVDTGGNGIRIAANLPRNSVYFDRTPASGILYQYRARALGANSATADSAWSPLPTGVGGGNTYDSATYDSATYG